ncbi:MAG: hypothetical protein IT580_01150, partial [Verrucomicrobiales bacterium]|nr:hypothetical protein [Verrucomicrobiales bacterium]
MAGLASLAMLAGATTAPLTARGAAGNPTATASGTSPAPAPAAASLEHLALTPDFAQRIRDRETIDAYLRQHHLVADSPAPATFPPLASRRVMSGAIRTVRRPTDEATTPWLDTKEANVRVPRGFRSPVLGAPTPVDLASPHLLATNATQQAAADLIEQRLATDGLLLTTALALEKLGVPADGSDMAAAVRLLARLGLPVDLLPCFQDPSAPTTKPTPELWVARIADALRSGMDVNAWRATLARAQFHFTPSMKGYAAALESGQHEIGLVRMQLGGGGWRDGIVPGGILHVIWQVAEALPGADYLVSVPAEFADHFALMAGNSWRLRRRDQLLILAEPLRVSAWAQDNGKAGLLHNDSGTPQQAATLVPRYASQGDGLSMLEPKDTLAAAGLRAAGHAVAQSPLLFQGGNLQPILAPGTTHSRLLLIGEGEIARNVVLGLTPSQVETALQVEFAVDRTIVLPSVSFHLDFDMTLRTQGETTLAFVNDPPAAARLLAGLGVEALARHGVLSTQTLAAAQSHLQAGRDHEFLQLLLPALPSLTGSAHEYPAELTRAFVTRPLDDGRAHLQILLIALDLLESGLPPAQRLSAHPERGAYLDALRRMETARRHQNQALTQLGLRLVPIPSMPDLSRSV